MKMLFAKALFYVVAVFAGAAFFWSADHLLLQVLAQQREKVQAPHAAPLQGRAVQRKSAELTRFREPILRPPGIAPLAIAGHGWHWHPSYGWVALPVGTVQEIVLPATYALPNQVQVYEAAALSNCTTQCPHCGQPLQLSIR